jgi:hypothetical protein
MCKYPEECYLGFSISIYHIEPSFVYIVGILQLLESVQDITAVGVLNEVVTNQKFWFQLISFQFKNFYITLQKHIF